MESIIISQDWKKAVIPTHPAHPFQIDHNVVTQGCGSAVKKKILNRIRIDWEFERLLCTHCLVFKTCFFAVVFTHPSAQTPHSKDSCTHKTKPPHTQRHTRRHTKRNWGADTDWVTRRVRWGGRRRSSPLPLLLLQACVFDLGCFVNLKACEVQTASHKWTSGIKLGSTKGPHLTIAYCYNWDH